MSIPDVHYFLTTIRGLRKDYARLTPEDGKAKRHVQVRRHTKCGALSNSQMASDFLKNMKREPKIMVY